ncbi:MAG: hypothetical protein K5874_01420 [Bacteroidaceae bacterium]|nr:hypothetical protein [Bacteroidaceae bacterium]
MIYLKFKKDIKHTSEYSINTLGNKKVSNFKSRVPAILFMIVLPFLMIIAGINALFEKIFKRIPDDVDSVDTWYIEFDDQEYNVAIREVGLDKDGRYAVIAPYKDYLGFWCDEDFNFDFYNTIVGVEEISKEQFEQVWNAFSEDNTTHGKKRKNK